MIEEHEKEMIKAGADAALKSVNELIIKLFGGPCEEIGGMWTDKLKFRREQRWLKLMQKVEAKIDTSGHEPHAIADKIWVPTWQAASLEDEDTLQDKYAALLANASDPKLADSIEPIFVSILSEITTRQTVFIDSFYEFDERSRKGLPESLTFYGNSGFPISTLLSVYSYAKLSRVPDLHRFTHGQPDDVQRKYDLDISEFTVMLEALKRHQLIEQSAMTEDVGPVSIGSPSRPQKTVKLKAVYRLTPLGRAFVRACKTATDPKVE